MNLITAPLENFIIYAEKNKIKTTGIGVIIHIFFIKKIINHNLIIILEKKKKNIINIIINLRKIIIILFIKLK